MIDKYFEQNVICDQKYVTNLIFIDYIICCFILANHLKKHVEEAHDGVSNDYKCEQCNKSFSLAFELKRHTENEHAIDWADY